MACGEEQGSNLLLMLIGRFLGILECCPCNGRSMSGSSEPTVSVRFSGSSRCNCSKLWFGSIKRIKHPIIIRLQDYICEHNFQFILQLAHPTFHSQENLNDYLAICP